MEYSNTYIDTGEIGQLEGDQNSSEGSSSQYMHAERGVTESIDQPIVDEEELLAAQEAAEAAVVQQQQNGTPGGVFGNVAQGLTGKSRDSMMQYWQETINAIEHDEHDFKNHQLPLARIKKVMKTDEDVRMISAEAPILFAKGCDIFITELTMRAWVHAEENKRRTLQKSDIAAALTKSDMFDFLIDVVPREEEKPKKSYATRTDPFGAQPPSSMSRHMLNGMRDTPSPSIPHVPSTSSGNAIGNRPPQHPSSIPHAAAKVGHSDRQMYGTSSPVAMQGTAMPSSRQEIDQLQSRSQTQTQGQGQGQGQVLQLQDSIQERSTNAVQGFISDEGRAGITADGNGNSGANSQMKADSSGVSSQPIKPEGAFYQNFTSYENNF